MSMIAEKLGYIRILALGIVGYLVSGIGMLLSPNPLMGMIFAILAGVFMSPFFPISIAIGGLMYPDKKGSLTGLFTVFASSGSMIFPAVCGYLADITGDVRTAMFLLPLVAVIPLVLFYVKAKKQLTDQLAKTPHGN